MSIFHKIIFGAVALVVGIVVALGDYATQWAKADGAFGPRQYVGGLFVRFGDSDTFMGDIFRTSALVTPALPPAPEGWRQVAWIDVPYGLAYSAAQDKALDYHLSLATGDMTSLQTIASRDEERFETYMNDTSMIYLTDASYVELTLEVEGYELTHPVWAEYIDRMDHYFEALDSRKPYADFQGLGWYEIRGPVENASNDGLPHELRMFEANMGRVEIKLTTRGPKAEIDGFLKAMDLTALRKLNDTPLGEMPNLAPEPAPEVTAQAETGGGVLGSLLSLASPASASASPTAAVVVNRTSVGTRGNCGAGQFCTVGQ